MADDVLPYLTIRQVADRLRRRELSPVELTTAILDRIDRLEPRLNAFITVMREEALEQARQAEQALGADSDLGPLHGVPISLKDLYQTAGVKTTGGSKILADWVPTADSTVTRRLREAGAVIVGKNNLHEFAYGATNENPHHGSAHNPWDLERITGGSSGGSGAAVAAGLGYASMGSDTGGSIRCPAALCGTVGIKPTYGRVSRTGVLPLSWSLDHCGPLTRTVEDAAIILNAISGRDPADPASADRPVPDFAAALDGDVSGLRVGVIREYFGESVQPEVAAAVRAAIADLERLGARIDEVSIPEDDYALGTWNAIGSSEATAIHEQWLKTRRDEYGPDVLERLLQGQHISALHYLKGQRARRVLIDRATALFERVDLLASPTTAIVAPTTAESRGAAARGQLLGFTRLFNILGLPTISVPCVFSSNGLPIGLQLAGRPFDEENVLRAAHAYEQQASWHTRRPSL